MHKTLELIVFFVNFNLKENGMGERTRVRGELQLRAQLAADCCLVGDRVECAISLIHLPAAATTTQTAQRPVTLSWASAELHGQLTFDPASLTYQSRLFISA